MIISIILWKTKHAAVHNNGRDLYDFDMENRREKR